MFRQNRRLGDGARSVVVTAQYIKIASVEVGSCRQPQGTGKILPKLRDVSKLRIVGSHSNRLPRDQRRTTKVTIAQNEAKCQHTLTEENRKETKLREHVYCMSFGNMA